MRELDAGSGKSDPLRVQSHVVHGRASYGALEVGTPGDAYPGERDGGDGGGGEIMSTGASRRECVSLASLLQSEC